MWTIFKAQLFCYLFLLLNHFTHGQVNDTNDITIPINKLVKIGKLPNGFTYYIQKNNKPANRVVFYLVNKVGSVLETEEQRGLAHLVEHMSFNGTKHFPKNELVDYLQKAGVRFGADLNATTSFDETIYQLPVRSDDKNVLKNAVQILRDWAQDATLDGAEIDKERGVVLEERRQRLGSSQRIQDKVMPVIMNGSRYAYRLPIGTEEVLKNFSHETIRQFYKDWYRPDLQALVVVGDIDVKSMEKMIISMFSDLRNPVHLPERTKYFIPLLNKNQFISVTDDEAAGGSMTIYFKHEAEGIRTKDDLLLSMRKSLFNQMLNARFGELYQQENIPFVTLNGSISDLVANIGSLTLNVQPKPNEYERSFKMLWTEMERIKRFGFLPSELERAKVNFISSFESAKKEVDNIPSDSYVKEYVRNFLEGEVIPGIEFEYAFYTRHVKEVTVGDINNLFNDYFKGNNRDIVITAHTKDKSLIPSENVIQQWMEEVERVTVVAYTDNQVTGELIAKLPPAGTIVSEKKIWGKADVTELMLSNGIRVLLKPTDFKNNEILFSGMSPGGTSLVDDSNYHAAGLAATVIGASGVGNFSATALQKRLAGKRVSVSPMISSSMEGFSGNASTGDLETALQLLYLYFTKPRKDPVVFNSIRERFKVNYYNTANLPATVFNDTVTAVSTAHHFRRLRPTPLQVDNISLDEIFEIYNERFCNSGDFTFVFVGSFEIEKIRPLLNRYLGSLPAMGRKEEAVDLKMDVARGIHSSKLMMGKEQQARVILKLSGDYVPDRITDAQLSTLASVLQFRLTERLREQESGVYTVSANASLRRVPRGEYTMNISFVCDPKNVEVLILSVFSEINKIKQGGALEADIDKVKAASLQQKRRLLKENGFWVSHITKNVLEGSEDEIEDVVADGIWNAITAESLQEIARRYLNGENYMRFVLLPEGSVR